MVNIEQLCEERKDKILDDLKTSGIHFWRGLDPETVHQIAEGVQYALRGLTTGSCIWTHSDHLEIRAHWLPGSHHS